MEYFLDYLIDILFTILSGVVVYIYKKIKYLVNVIEINKNSMLVLCKNLFIQKFYYYKRENYICIWEKETLKNLYSEYKKLGGNGIVDELFKEIDEIPIIKED